MSISIWLSPEETFGPPFDDYESRNITHNISPMWRLAGCYDALYEGDGKSAETQLPALEVGLDMMLEQPARFRALNASNGWGTYEAAVTFLTAVVADFRAYPKATIRVHR